MDLSGFIERPERRARGVVVWRRAAEFEFRHAAGGGRPLALSPESERAIVEHAWPGNVRELENLVRRLVALYPQDTISREVVESERRVTLTGSDPYLLTARLMVAGARLEPRRTGSPA